MNKTLYLLGSGVPKKNLTQRRKLAKILREEPYNYDVYLMEDYRNPSWIFTWSEKFMSVLSEKKPKLTCVIFPDNAKHNSVEWELGLLSCKKCTFERFSKGVSFFLSKKTALKELSMYSKQYVNPSSTSKFTKWDDLPKLIDKIYKIKQSRS